MESEMEVEMIKAKYASPYLAAIQSINGQYAGENYKKLNLLVREIIAVNHATGNEIISTIESQKVPPALIPLVRILVGNELKIKEEVVEALKSSDIVVVNKALRAKWFYHGSNDFVNVNYFNQFILRFVSLKTRSRVINVLSKALLREERKAEEFFNAILDAYCLKEALPFLPYCGKKFAIQIILDHKVILSTRLLNIFFRTHSDLAIHYLRLGYHGDVKVVKVEKDQKVPIFPLNKYNHFLPHLTKHHASDYIELISRTLDTGKHLGSKRTRNLCQQAKEDVLARPVFFLKLCRFKLLYKNMSKEEFRTFFMGLFTSSCHEFSFQNALNYLVYYPKGERLNIIMDTYKKKYNRNLLENLNMMTTASASQYLYDSLNTEDFETVIRNSYPRYVNLFRVDEIIALLAYYPQEKKLTLLKEGFQQKYQIDLLQNIQYIKSEKLLNLLPNDEKADVVRRLIESDKHTTIWHWYLPPDETFEFFKEEFKKVSTPRNDRMRRMILSCKLYEDQNQLSIILEYFDNRCKLKQPSILFKIFEYLIEYFRIEILTNSNWKIFYRLLLRSYLKNELFRASDDLLKKVFEGSLYRLFAKLQEKETENEISDSISKILDMYLEYTIEAGNYTIWTILQSDIKIELEFIEKLLHRIPIRYPEFHRMWKINSIKKMALNKVVKKLTSFNDRLRKTLHSDGVTKNELGYQLTRVRNYPWLEKISIDVLKSKTSNRSSHALLKTYDEEFYSSIVPPEKPKVNFHQQVKIGEACLLLRRNQDEIISNWEEYLYASRKLLHSKSQSGYKAAKKFILVVKWCKELPIKFAERCLLEIHQVGSLTILGLLLDGETLGEVISEYMPKKPYTLDLFRPDAREHFKVVSSIPRAMNETMPPVTARDVVSLFQGEYVKWGLQTVFNFGRRIGFMETLAFVNLLNETKSVTGMKQGVRLTLQILPAGQLGGFLAEVLSSERHPDVVKVIFLNVFRKFTQSPSQKTWLLISKLISKLRRNDDPSLAVLSDIAKIKNIYATLFVHQLLVKIENLADEDTKNNLEWKDTWICHILKNTCSGVIHFMPKDFVFTLLKKYYFRAESKKIWLAAKVFGQNAFMRSFDDEKKSRSINPIKLDTVIGSTPVSMDY